MAYIRKRGNKYYFTIWVRENGKTIKHEYAGGSSKSEAEKRFRQCMAETDRTGKYFEPSAMLFKDYLHEWIKKYASVYLKPNTVDLYESVIQNHIIVQFGLYKLMDITTAELQDWLIELLDQYSRSTVKTIMSCLRSALRWAVANRRYLVMNPMDNVTLPPCHTAAAKPKLFTSNDIHKIFEKFSYGNKIHIVCALSYYTGMRLGECLALTWNHINLDDRTIQVVGTMYDKNSLPTITSTKTVSSERTILFGSKLYNELKKQKLWQFKNSLKYGPLYKKNDFVCTTEKGRMITSNTMRYFGAWCHKKLGYGSFHSFRHTHASMLLAHGLPLDYVSKRLGHSSIYTTANIYDTITDKREKDAVNVMETFL